VQDVINVQHVGCAGELRKFDTAKVIYPYRNDQKLLSLMALQEFVTSNGRDIVTSTSTFLPTNLDLQHHNIIFYVSFRSPDLFYLITVGVEVVYFHLITLRHTPQSVGLLWTRDRLVAETSN
jgi:hypothetical protein